MLLLYDFIANCFFLCPCHSYPSLAFEVVSDQHRRIRGRSRAQFGTRNDKTIVKTDENVRIAREGWYSNVEWTYFDSEGHSKTERGVYYICDNGYCRWKVTICPFKHFNSTSPEGQWSDNLESVRKDVECCFGILKKRWRIIDYGLKFRSMELCEKVFVSCCIQAFILASSDVVLLPISTAISSSRRDDIF